VLLLWLEPVYVAEVRGGNCLSVRLSSRKSKLETFRPSFGRGFSNDDF
jgi:hypothetical protein